MSFAVVVDSTCDFTQEEYKALDVHMVPLSVLIDGETFKDQVEITSEQFYERMANLKVSHSLHSLLLTILSRCYNALAEQGL